MASQVSPGIRLRERDLSNAVVVGASEITAAHASTFQKGPIGKVVNIASQKELISVFGAPTDQNAEDFFVASEFLGYGGRLAVVRAATGVNSASSAGGAVLVKSDEDWEAGNGNGNLLVARTAGAWGNSLKVVAVDRGADQLATLTAAPAGLSAGDTVTFTGGKKGVVHSWDAASLTAAIILDDPTSRLTTSDSIDSPDTGVIAGAGTIVGGTGYQSASAVPVSGGSGTGATVNITVTSGVPLTVAGGAGGTAYATATAQGTTGGTGTGLTVDIVASAGAVTSIAIANPGSGYTVGDVITIAGGGSDATFTIATVEGAVGAVAVEAGGSGYVAGEVLTIGGGNGDATFEVASVTDTAITISAVKDWYTNTLIPGTNLTLGAIGPRPGTSAFAAERGVSYDELHLAVVDTDGAVSGAANTILERILFVSKLSDGRNAEGAANFYRDVITAQSEYFFNGTALPAPRQPESDGGGTAVDGTAAASAGKLLLMGAMAWDLSGGTDDYAYNVSEIETAFDEFSDTELVPNLNFVLMGGSLSTELDTKAKANKAIALAAGRKDCIAFVSPHKGNQVGSNGALTAVQQRENTLNFFNGMTSTSYAVFDSGYKYFYDRFNDKYRYIPCNGDIAGLCVATSSLLDDWYSPAGVNRGSLRNAIKLAYNPSKADRDELYQSRINPVVIFPGSGVTLFGDKTALTSPSSFDRINVRRLFLNVERRIGDLAKSVLFEQNDAITRSSFLGAANSYLAEVQARRGVTDFLVVCDETNNTPDVIDRNEFVAELFLKPTRSINYITVTFTATKTGVSFQEVVGS
tara:strand:- start:4022 stop:6442 length:2421 start_codon:yes stop_codon:yes gene_type:complete